MAAATEMTNFLIASSSVPTHRVVLAMTPQLLPAV